VARAFYVRSWPIDHSVSGPTSIQLGRGARCVLGALLSTTISLAAHAEAPVPVAQQGSHVTANALRGTTVIYEAPAGCPSQSDFEARLRARGGNRGAGATAPPPLQRVEARITAKGKRAEGTVVITDAAGAATTRKIVAASCAEAVDALALIVALTLDPLQASESPQASSVVSGSSEEGGTSSPTASAESSKAGSNAEQRAPASRAANERNAAATASAIQSVPPAEPSIGPDTESRRGGAGAADAVRFGAFVSALVASGATPDPAFGGQVGFKAVVLPGAPRLSGGIGARIVMSQTVHDAAGTASFDWWAGFAAMCAGAHIGSTSVSLDLCATFELGRLAASGSNTQNPASAVKSWQALGPALNAEWVFAPPVLLTVGVEGLFPFHHQRFLVGEDVVHQVPTVALRAQGGVGLRF
jgi:hypothetical protein